MFKLTGQTLELLAGLLLSTVQHSDQPDDQHNDQPDDAPPRHRPRWRHTLSYFAVDDMSQMRLAVCDWIERRGNPQPCDLKGSGGGATLSAGPLVVDVSGGGMRDRYHDTGEQRAFRGGSGGASIGLPLIKTRALRIYPLVGVGGAGGRLDRDDTPGWAALFFTTGIGIDLRVPLLWFKIVIGVRAGYHHEIANIQHGDGPEFEQPRGPFLRFIVGPYRDCP